MPRYLNTRMSICICKLAMRPLFEFATYIYWRASPVLPCNCHRPPRSILCYIWRALFQDPKSGTLESFWLSTPLTGIYRDTTSTNALLYRFNFLFCQASALRCTKSSHEPGSAVYFRRKMTPCNSALERNRTSFRLLPETFSRVDCMPRCITDPLIHHGRHFGRTQHALCSIRLLLKNGLLRIDRLSNSNHSVTVRFVLVSRSVS